MGNKQGTQSSAGAQQQAPSRQPAPARSNHHHHHHQHHQPQTRPSAPTSAQYPSSPNQIQVRCPACTRKLIPPPNAPRFKCPCGQFLQLPSNVLGRTNVAPVRPPVQQQPQRMRCPNCANILLAPPGVPRFRCPTCSVILAPPQRRPGDGSANSNQIQTANRPKRRSDLDLNDLNDVVAAVAAVSDSTANDIISNTVDSTAKEGPAKKWTGSVSEHRISWRCSNPEEAKVAYIRSWNWTTRELSWETAKEGYDMAGLQMPPRWYWANVQQVKRQPFGPKLKWFRDYISKLQVEWAQGHHKIEVRRSNLLEDSTQKFMDKKPIEFRKIFRFKFTGEPALDAGGVAREWYDQLTATLFNLDFGLFTFCGGGKYTINDSSDIANEHHLYYFHFAGRLLGKALFSGQLVDAHLAKPILKLIIGLPLVLDDLASLDGEIYKSLQDVIAYEEDIDDLCLTFDVRKQVFGAPVIVNLKEGGSDIEVDDDNKDEYIKLMFKYYMFGSIKKQLEKLLLGFYEVIPPFLVAIFSPEELELLLCGLPTVNVDDWQKHMRYFGVFSERHKVVRWFFEVVREFSHEERGKLLQFTTGSSAVPVEGFKALQSHDGKLCWFALKSIPLEKQLYPIAHTCFNRLDLPLYKSKAELKRRLLEVSNMKNIDFGIE